MQGRRGAMPGLELALWTLSQPGLAPASCPGAGVQAQAGTGGHRLSPSGAGPGRTWGAHRLLGVPGDQGELAELPGPGDKGPGGQLGMKGYELDSRVCWLRALAQRQSENERHTPPKCFPLGY